MTATEDAQMYKSLLIKYIRALERESDDEDLIHRVNCWFTDDDVTCLKDIEEDIWPDNNLRHVA